MGGTVKSCLHGATLQAVRCACTAAPHAHVCLPERLCASWICHRTSAVGRSLRSRGSARRSTACNAPRPPEAFSFKSPELCRTAFQLQLPRVGIAQHVRLRLQRRCCCTTYTRSQILVLLGDAATAHHEHMTQSCCSRGYNLTSEHVASSFLHGSHRCSLAQHIATQRCSTDFRSANSRSPSRPAFPGHFVRVRFDFQHESPRCDIMIC